MIESVEIKRLLKIGQVFLIILTIFVLAGVFYVFRLFGNVERNTPISNLVTVNGQGEVFALPDIATFSFGATANAKTVTEAQAQVTKKINKALDLMKAAGVEEKDIKTTDYSVYPKYEYSNYICTQAYCPSPNQRLVGYEVSQNISVKIRKIEDSGKILESLGSTEVTNISGLQFTIDDEDKLMAEARALAIADAKEKGKILARDLDVKLVKIVNFYESGNQPIPYYRDGMEFGMGGDNPLPTIAKAEIPTGQSKIVSNVSITYEIR